MRARDVIVALLMVLAITAIGTFYVAVNIDGELSRHGWIALSLGIGATILLAIGLMSLVFISHHRGIDDRVNKPDDY